jgi:hypothetical protein
MAIDKENQRRREGERRSKREKRSKALPLLNVPHPCQRHTTGAGEQIPGTEGHSQCFLLLCIAVRYENE